MTLNQVVRQLQRIALTQHNVRTVGEGDLYADLSATPSLKYDVFYITQNQHQTEGDFDRYSFNLFYISRQENVDGSNSLQVQSIGKEVLENVIKIFCDEYFAEVYGTIYFQPFVQRFADLTAGIYAIITLQVPKDSICID
jgi:hypothetical protein